MAGSTQSSPFSFFSQEARDVSTYVTTDEYIADGITPIAAYACVSRVVDGPSFLLESAPGPQQTARYSIIGLGHAGELRASQGRVVARAGAISQTFDGTQVLDGARWLVRALRPANEVPRPWSRFLGAYGCAAFELAGYFERLPTLPHADDPMPDLHLVVPSTIVVFDHFSHRVAVLGMSRDESGASDEGRGRMRDALGSAAIPPLDDRAGDRPDVEVPSRARYVGMVERAQESSGAGDVFQIVLSQAWKVRSEVTPFDAYRRLRAINPSPYMYYVDFGWGPLLGSSPEVLVRLDGPTARLRPLAGTRPRDADPERERRTAARLKRDAKERAEHVMLVDLGRNDLGRACTVGTVRVTDLLSVEYYSHVMHLVSEVRGSMRSDRDAFDLFACAFPAGTVSGAPKIRAMELIAELEQRRRGFYAGSVGYFGFDGSMDACITLRSAHCVDGAYRVQAGAGIVADSAPASEYDECAAKAAAVLQALGVRPEVRTPAAVGSASS